MSNTQKYAEGGQFEKHPEMVGIKLGEKMWDVLWCESEEEKEKGLMDVEKMEPNEGAIFVYDSPAPRDFWMHDTEIPLDIIFIDPDGVVISVKEGKPLTDDFISEDNVQYVVELNRGSGIKSGDELELDDEDEYPDLEPNKLYVIGSDGEVQATLKGGERIVSRRETRVLLRKAKRAYKTKSEADYKALGRYMFGVLDRQDSRKPEYVEQKN